MSRQVDPHNLSKSDIEYLRQRPLIVQEFELQGFPNPLEDDYKERLAAMQDPDDENEPDTPFEEPDEEPEPDEDDESDDGVKADVEDSEFTLYDQLPDNKKWDHNVDKDGLKAVIDRRNEGYDDDEQIVPKKDTRDAYREALKLDDEELKDTPALEAPAE